MAAQTGLDRYYSRIERVLKGIAFSLKLFFALEFLLRLATVFLIILLGSIFVQKAERIFPYLPFVYYLLALIFLLVVFSLGLWKSAAKLSMQYLARVLEEKLPRLKDNVVNAVLLFHQIKNSSGPDSVSRGLVTAHLRKTAEEVTQIHPRQVVTFGKVLPHLRFLIPLFVAFTVALALDAQFFNRSLATLFDPLSTLPEREVFILVEQPPRLCCVENRWPSGQRHRDTSRIDSRLDFGLKKVRRSNSTCHLRETTALSIASPQQRFLSNIRSLAVHPTLPFTTLVSSMHRTSEKSN